VEHLREHEAEVGKAALKVYGLDVVETDHPDDFTLEFLADRDDSRVWRVDSRRDSPSRLDSMTEELPSSPPYWLTLTSSIPLVFASRALARTTGLPPGP